ncbi:MAG: heavy-metal-associated domain-containing protein, partial [Verrucomicrobiales bacterium]|nr:heavy-metal-associated domain-containing protein [Verrucomicrobiales bacterium]
TLAFALFPNYAGLFFKDGQRGLTPATHGDSDKMHVAIEGMMCEACAKVLQKKLATFPGVASAEVSYEKKTAVLHLSERNSPRIDQLLARIKNAGYGGAVVSLPSTEMAETKSAINQENRNENTNNDRNR